MRMVKTTKNMRVWTTMAFPLVVKLLNSRFRVVPGTWNNRPGESRMKSTKPSNIGAQSAIVGFFLSKTSSFKINRRNADKNFLLGFGTAALQDPL